MKTYTVRELMVPLAEYATVNESATLADTVLALEAAQAEFDKSRYRHRAILVLDNAGNVVGKVSQMDVLRALEPKYDGMQTRASIAPYSGFTTKYIKLMLSAFELWNKPMSDICLKGSERNVGDFMYKPSEGEYIDENATMDEAVHQLIIGRHQSLLVMNGDKVSGILRLTDVFSAVAESIKHCGI